jgi:hypothetical protein
MKYCNIQEVDYDALLSLLGGGRQQQGLQALEDQIRDYIIYLKANRKLSSNSINLYIAAIAHFYSMNNIRLNWKRLAKFKGKKRLVLDDQPYAKEHKTAS